MSILKRIGCVITVLTIICVIVTTSSAAVSVVQLGDVDGDGTVTAGDARSILRHAARLELLDDVFVADVDQDGSVTAADARLALRISCRLEPPVYLTIDDPKDDEYTIVEDTVCKYCGRLDCPAVVYDPKLGASRFDESRAELCPQYTKPTETQQQPEPEPIPEPCEFCGCLVGHNDLCLLYSETDDASLFCQTCHLPVGFGPDKCVQFNQNITCSECGQFVEAWECHHCSGK